VHSVLDTSGRPLPPSPRGDMEQRFGWDFSRVRIHTDGVAAESARHVGALAYTVGRHIVFGADRFAPATPGGARLLAHELSHVVQQSGTKPVSSAPRPLAMRASACGSIAIGDVDDVAEHDADRMADQALDRRPATAPEASVHDASPTLRKQGDPAAAGAQAANARLDRLATRPQLALREWRNLSQVERDQVVLIMMGRYGLPFGQEFLNYAKGLKRPRPGPAGVLKGPQYTPKWLFDRGYRHAHGELWVHPSGEELTVLEPDSRPQESEPGPIEERCPTSACFDETEDGEECRTCCEEKYPDAASECRRYCDDRCSDKL
jgi:hypothetical protein